MGNKKKITELQEYIQNLNFTCCRFQQSSFNKELKEQLDRKSAKASSPSSTDSTQPRFAEHYPETTEQAFFSSYHRNYTKIGQNLDYKPNLNKIKRIKTLLAMSSDHNKLN